MKLDKRGFTLIELLVVLIIIAVLATLALPQYTKYVEKARAAEALTMIGAMKNAEAAYKLENGAYTTNIANLSVGNIQTVDNTVQYWYYAISSTDTSSTYAIKANRSSKAGGDTTQYIQFDWSDATGASWSGNHVGKPNM